MLNYRTILRRTLISLSICLKLLCTTTNVHAYDSKYNDENEFYLNKLNYCTITKEKSNDYEPEEFSTSNNLLRQSGQSALFCGERIIIHGRILDKNCVGISDATVYIWQVGCSGRYHYKPLKDNINKDLFDTNHDITFVGNGTATTNNKGEFYFITLYPMAAHSIAPHINLRVKHMKFSKEYNFIMPLQGHKITMPTPNPDLAKIESIASKMGSPIYDFDIVLEEHSLDSF